VHEVHVHAGIEFSSRRYQLCPETLPTPYNYP
jgi:hypothetical protein